MNREQRERLVDSALDRALGPQAVEPRPGLEQRILANLQTQPAPRPWWQWMWIPALAAAAVLAVVLGMQVMQREAPAPINAKQRTEPAKPAVAVNPPRPEIGTIRPPTQTRKRVERRKASEPPVVVAKAEPQMPRLQTFPAPAPLSDQERLLLALSRRQRGEVELAANSQSADRERAQKYFDTGFAPGSEPSTSLDKR